MKIKVVKKSYSQVMALKRPPHRNPKKQLRAFGLLLKLLAQGDIKATHASYTETDMQLVGESPCLILMNHSSFIDLKLAFDYLYPRPFSIVCTSDGFVGKSGLMRALGCIPTLKYVTSPSLVKDIQFALTRLRQSVLMYPEAGYSFDGTATALPQAVGRLIKLLKVPVVTIITHGAFARDPLYNGLQLRKVDVSAEVRCLFTPQQIEEKTPEQLNEMLRRVFTFDNFEWQRVHNVRIDEPFRADGLNRVLYKCPNCGAEGKNVGKGSSLCCTECGKKYFLDEYGQLSALEGKTEFAHIPDWYAWEREQVKQEILEGRYGLDIEVNICMLVDYKALYDIGTGRLTHDADGFHLVGESGEPDYVQRSGASYGLNADYFWYELGDVICIGDNRALYYCFPKNGEDVVAKTRLATEELFKLQKDKK